MATYFSDFTGTTVGNQPASTTLKRSAASGDFTKQTADSEDVLRFLATAGGTPTARGLAFDDVPSSGVVEIVAEARDTSANSSDPESRLLAYAADSPDDEYGLLLDVNADLIHIFRRVSGSFAFLAQFSVTLDTSSYYMMRFRVTPGSPNQLQARIWDPAASEPATWDIDTTDGNLTLTSGWTGVAGYTQDYTVYWRRVGIGTDGDAAPTEASADQTIVLGRATETDVARPLAVLNPRSYLLGRATETDTARALTVANPRSYQLGRATETDTARPLIVANPRSYALGRAAEADTARSLTIVQPATTVALGRATETDVARALTIVNPRTYTLGRATESDVARPLTVVIPFTGTTPHSRIAYILPDDRVAYVAHVPRTATIAPEDRTVQVTKDRRSSYAT